MKKLNSLRICIVAIVAAAGFSSCGSDDGPSGTSENLMEIAESNGLTYFVDAVQVAGLTDLLESSTKRTVFAPSNLAMATYLSENGYADFEDVPPAELKELIRNHFINAEVAVSGMETGYRKTMAHGPASASNFLDIHFNLSSGISLNGNANVTTPDIDASNGKLHIVNRVIKLPTLYDFIAADPAISLYFGAISNDASMTGPLSESGTFTVFAPWDEGIEEINADLEYDAITNYTEAELEKLVKYHIVQGQNKLFSTINNGDVFSTLANQNVSASVSGGGRNLVDVNSRVVPFSVDTDVQATNGVMHILRRALKPTF